LSVVIVPSRLRLKFVCVTLRSSGLGLRVWDVKKTTEFVHVVKARRVRIAKEGSQERMLAMCVHDGFDVPKSGVQGIAEDFAEFIGFVLLVEPAGKAGQHEDFAVDAVCFADGIGG